MDGAALAPAPRLAEPGSVMTSAKRGRALLGDLVVAGVWTLFAVSFLERARGSGRVVDLGLFVFVTLLAVMFVLRRPARRTGAPWEMLLAVAGTILPGLLPRPAPGSWVWLGTGIQAASLVGMLVALAWLGRSFGIAPADRGLRTGGPYGWVRHPLYAAEILFYVGYVVAHPSWRNLAALVFGGAIQVFRIVREERILEGYAPYAARVRWRLLPLVW